MTGSYKKGIQTKAKTLSVAKKLFYEHGIKDVTGTEICKQANITYGNFTYYYKTKKDLVAAIIQEILETATAYADKLLPASSSLEKGCLSCHLFMLSVCRDPKAARFLEQVYSMDYRSIIPLFVEETYSTWFAESEKQPHSRHIHKLAVADAHARLALFLDLMERCNHKPEIPDILDMSDTVFELTCYILQVDSETLDRISARVHHILEQENYPSIALFNDN